MSSVEKDLNMTHQLLTYFSTKTVQGLKRRVRGYELRYGIKSDEMTRRLRTGEMQETESISRWLQAVKVLNRIQGKTHISGTVLSNTSKSIKHASKTIRS